MATTDAKPGFRLPWSADRGDDPVASDEATTPDAEAGATQEEHEVEPPAMIDSPAPEARDAAADAPAQATPPARKPNKLMADLTRAMQAAAEQARADALERLGADSKAFIESIHAASSTEATELRRKADDDVAAIREWSKAEIARIREETEQRIGDRKGALEREIDAHAAAIEGRIERVQARVVAFETEMAAFFERLTGEEDPTRLAAMAESLPEPPSFDAEADDEATAWIAPEPIVEADPVEAVEADPVVGAVEPESAAEAEPVEAAAEAPELEQVVEAELEWPTSDASADFAAAEAEAAAFAGDGVDGADLPELADDALAARLAALSPAADAGEPTSTTRVIVLGLISVASIASFKRHLTRSTGVASVGVSSGPDGEFVFAVAHAPDLDLAATVTGLPGFGARVTDASDGTLQVTARDPETEA